MEVKCIKIDISTEFHYYLFMVLHMDTTVPYRKIIIHHTEFFSYRICLFFVPLPLRYCSTVHFFHIKNKRENFCA